MHRAPRNPLIAIKLAIGCLVLLGLLGLPARLTGLELNGTAYTSLGEVAGRLGMESQWVEKGKTQKLESQWTTLVFEIHKREILLNGIRVHLGFPVAEYRGQLYLSESDTTHQLQPILTPQVFGRPPPVRHVIIDPGHGGDDPGARNTGLKLIEKHLTLDLAKRLKAKLEAKGMRVSMTRDTDRFIALEERGRIANASGADLFISLHFNASEKRAVAGVETFAFTPPFQPSTSRSSLHSSDQRTYPGNANDPWNTLLGYYVQRSLTRTLSTEDRGLKRARFAVLRELEIPGLLIEGGFVSNDREGRNVGSAAYRNRIVQGICDGLDVYLQTVERLSRNEP
jgi:N-acetylmuramoyl-L-alanine amidase